MKMQFTTGNATNTEDMIQSGPRHGGSKRTQSKQSQQSRPHRVDSDLQRFNTDDYKQEFADLAKKVKAKMHQTNGRVIQRPQSTNNCMMSVKNQGFL